MVNIAAALLDGTGRLAALSPQLDQQQDQLFVGATQQVASRYIQILKKCILQAINQLGSMKVTLSTLCWPTRKGISYATRDRIFMLTSPP